MPRELKRTGQPLKRLRLAFSQFGAWRSKNDKPGLDADGQGSKKKNECRAQHDDLCTPRASGENDQAFFLALAGVMAGLIAGMASLNVLPGRNLGR